MTNYWKSGEELYNNIMETVEKIENNIDKVTPYMAEELQNYEKKLTNIAQRYQNLSENAPTDAIDNTVVNVENDAEKAQRLIGAVNDIFAEMNEEIEQE